MFTRAGYNLRGACRWGFWARVSVIGGQRRGWAHLVEFASGDLAWYSSQGQFLIWGLRAHFVTHINIWERHSYSDIATREVWRGWRDRE